MTTKIYGASDDLVEVEGDVRGEVGYYGDDEKGVLLLCSDGTILNVKYGKPTGGIWAVVSLRDGDLFSGIDVCNDEDADPYSDVAVFRQGLKWVISAEKWARVK